MCIKKSRNLGGSDLGSLEFCMMVFETTYHLPSFPDNKMYPHDTFSLKKMSLLYTA